MELASIWKRLTEQQTHLKKMKNSRTYSIINISDINDIDFSQVIETSIDTVRKSLDETQFIIKYNITPSFINDGTVVPLQVLNYTEIMELLNSLEWSNDNE